MGNELHCLLANSDNTVTSAQGRWMYPDENPVNCDGTENANLGPFGCSITNQSDGVRLYKHDQLYSLSSEHSGVYTCCLPESCSDGSSSQITVRIYGEFHYFLILTMNLFENSSFQELKSLLMLMSLCLGM